MNIAGLLSRAAVQHRDAEAVRFGERAITFGELDERARRLGAALRDLGLVPGDAVALLQANGTEMVESMFGVWMAGMAVVPINSRSHPREAAYMIEDCDAKAVIYGDEYEEGLLESLGPDPSPHLISLASGGQGSSYEGLFDGPAPLPQPTERGQADLAWLFYTSGTTGRPKGAMLTHRNLRQMILAHLADLRSFEPGEPVLHAAPLSHGSGHVMLACIARGARNVIYPHRSFDGDAVLRIVVEESIRSIAFVAPTQIVVLNRAAGPDAADLPLESVCYGGAPMFLEDLRTAMSSFGPVFVQLYGQGEAPMTISKLTRADHERFFASGDPRLGSAGVPRTDVELRIVDETDREVQAGERGEILVRGDVVMAGYWKNEAATAAALSDGWLRTGDIGMLDDAGYLFLLDRSKDMIISGGNNIYPREVEEAILTMPEVTATAVIGVPDPYWGESVHALVVTTADSVLTAEEVIEHCRNRMSSYKKPSSVEFVEALPTNAYGKVLKRDLRARHGVNRTNIGT